MSKPHSSIVLGLCLAALLVACGGDGLEEASEELARIESEVERARQTLEERKQEADRAEGAVEEARRALTEAESQLAEARRNVAEQIDDADLFREVQGRLLDDRNLEGVAISARVADRVVTLDGKATSKAQKERAEEIAKGVAGVAGVVNQIAVDVATPPK